MKLFETTGEVTEIKKVLAGTEHTVRMDFLGGYSCKVIQNPTSGYEKDLHDFIGKPIRLVIETIESKMNTEPLFKAIKQGE